MLTLNYTTIHHETRKRLGLTMNEYAVADLIYHLQNNPSSIMPGWCYASRTTMGEILDISERRIRSNIDKLESKGLVIKNPETSHVQTTEKWYFEAILTQADETSGTRTKRPTPPDETSGHPPAPPNRNIYINNNSEKPAPLPSLLEDSQIIPAAPHSKTYSDTKETQTNIKPHSKREWLQGLGPAEIAWFQEPSRFPNLDEAVIRRQAQKAFYWLESKGRLQKDYRAFLYNWLDNDLPKANQGKVKVY